MGRPTRICQPDLTYHTYSRCINCMNMMSGKKFKDLFIKVIRLAKKKYTFELNHYVIMNNHFHLVIKTVKHGQTISRIMQFIKSLFARLYNKIAGRTGPLWNERFKDKIVEKQKNPLLYALRLFWYIAYNPVRAGQVTDPREYIHSSINFYLTTNYKPEVELTHHSFFENLGKSFSERSHFFKSFEYLYSY